MTYPVALPPDLVVGWQKVADRYNIPIYIFQTGRRTKRFRMTPRRGVPIEYLGSSSASSEASRPTKSTAIID